MIHLAIKWLVICHAITAYGQEERRTYLVTTLTTPPFVMMGDASTTSRNDSFYGYIPDLLDRLSEITNLRFQLYLVPDGNYGSLNRDGEWNGLIGELTNGRADMAAAAITISSQRSRVVDFIPAFMHSGITAVMKRPVPPPIKGGNHNHLLMFRPFTAPLWICLIVAYLLVSLGLWVVNKFYPYYTDAAVAETDSHSLSYCFWIVFTTLQWQGFGKEERSIASRILICFWMGFVTMVLLTYTAALLHQYSYSYEREDPVILPQTIEEIIHNPDIDYGAIGIGSTSHFFMSGRGPMHDAFRKYVAKRPEEQTSFMTAEDGIEMVRNGNGKYAFLCSMSIALMAANKKPCDLVVIRDELNICSYGFTFPIEHLKREAIHQAMLLLRETGELEALKRKWFFDRGECWAEHNDIRGHPLRKPERPLKAVLAPDLSLHVFMYPLIFMVVGFIMTLITAIFEILYFRYKVRNG